MTSSLFAKRDEFIETDGDRIEVTNTVASGNQEITTLTADAGEIWEIVGVALFLSPPTKRLLCPHPFYRSVWNPIPRTMVTSNTRRTR